jgi:hypothetical protein
LLGGLFTPADNQFILTDDQVSDLFNEEYYINIHTTLAPEGEIRSQILPKVNFYPTAPNITAPANESMLVLEGDSATTFTATWSPAVDSNFVAYTWQLSASSDFSTILVNQPVGNELMFSTSFGIVDDLLGLAGIEVGGSVNLYHRVVATDGALVKVGPTALVTVQRGAVTGTRDLLSSLDWGLQVYPNVSTANREINIAIRAAQSTNARLILFENTGRQIRIDQLQLQPGDNLHPFLLPDLSAGTYYLNLAVDGQLLPARRILIKK